MILVKALPWIKSAAVVVWLSLFVHVILLPFSLIAVGSIGALLLVLTTVQIVLQQRLTGRAVPQTSTGFKWGVTGAFVALVVALHYSPSVMVSSVLATVFIAIILAPIFFGRKRQA
ncbi:hypothetical protein FC34_GL000950 [Lacticaseibacillus brantae DSM 23927]|uniref:Uncharacterized protein n=1 Tax=Lacticaseibacillus brantae DSM 23927 TaxID=1423727 RepID=A0A0R2AWZ5_9LACO|nr:hypothetical protein FC34_GL000950 [Lacticaseibacillus brantae DSM 23927]